MGVSEKGVIRDLQKEVEALREQVNELQTPEAEDVRNLRLDIVGLHEEIKEKDEIISVSAQQLTEIREGIRGVVGIPQGDGCPACRNKDRALRNL